MDTDDIYRQDITTTENERDRSKLNKGAPLAPLLIPAYLAGRRRGGGYTSGHMTGHAVAKIIGSVAGIAALICFGVAGILISRFYEQYADWVNRLLLSGTILAAAALICGIFVLLTRNPKQ